MEPIEQFVKTDDEDQPTLHLLTELGLSFQGRWDPSSGYFFVTRVLNKIPMPDQIMFVSNMELPGRLYTKVTHFQIIEED